MGRKAYTPEQIIGKLRDELLNREIFTTLTEAKIVAPVSLSNQASYSLAYALND
jgi:hypothetical protein